MREQILDAAVEAARGGLHCVTVRGVARAVGVNHRTVAWYFKNIAGLRQATAETAIERDDAKVIARLIMDEDPNIRDWPKKTRRAYLTV